VDEEWKTEELLLVVRPEHKWASRRTIPPDWLVEEEILGGEGGTGTGRILREALGDLADDLHITQNLGSTEGVKEGIKAGLGVSVLMTASVQEEIESGSLVGIRLSGAKMTKSIRLVRSADLSDSAPAVQFSRALIGSV
ncbi:MAG: LysR substrate-binding domain-containing protein, partial [Verrucomicrobiota bacterium]